MAGMAGMDINKKTPSNDGANFMTLVWSCLHYFA